MVERCACRRTSCGHADPWSKLIWCAFANATINRAPIVTIGKSGDLDPVAPGSCANRIISTHSQMPYHRPVGVPANVNRTEPLFLLATARLRRVALRTLPLMSRSRTHVFTNPVSILNQSICWWTLFLSRVCSAVGRRPSFPITKYWTPQGETRERAWFHMHACIPT